MKSLAFFMFIFIQLPCYGQCFIDKKYIDAFCNSFPRYEVSSIGKSYGFGESDVITSREYILSNGIGLDTTSENEIFYDIVHLSEAKKDNILKFLKAHSMDSVSAKVLATYMLCRHNSKYSEWKERKRQRYLEMVKSGQIEPFNDVYLVVDQNPEFPGGQPGLTKFISDNLKYPYEALLSHVEGKVFVQMVIDQDGYIISPVIAKAIGHGCDEEALRIVNSMPRWKPGIKDGGKVCVRYNIPVLFKIQ